MYDLLFEINKVLNQLNDWELKFIKSVNHKVDHRINLSNKQMKKIFTIYYKLFF